MSMIPATTPTSAGEVIVGVETGNATAGEAPASVTNTKIAAAATQHTRACPHRVSPAQGLKATPTLRIPPRPSSPDPTSPCANARLSTGSYTCTRFCGLLRPRTGSRVSPLLGRAQDGAHRDVLAQRARQHRDVLDVPSGTSGRCPLVSSGRNYTPTRVDTDRQT